MHELPFHFQIKIKRGRRRRAGIKRGKSVLPPLVSSRVSERTESVSYLPFFPRGSRIAGTLDKLPDRIYCLVHEVGWHGVETIKAERTIRTGRGLHPEGTERRGSVTR